MRWRADILSIHTHTLFILIQALNKQIHKHIHSHRDSQPISNGRLKYISCLIYAPFHSMLFR